MNLSVIVPILNEGDCLPGFLDMLSAQRDIGLELILVDGGSTDGSIELLQQRVADYRWPLQLVASERGRARQLNAGAERASSDKLLFLHVDSRFKNENALAAAVEEFDSCCAASASDKVAGHFRLKFSRSHDNSSFGYYFWEVKARLDRPECTHGDQGFLLRKSFFKEVGPFDVEVPIAEDTRLAERVRRSGQWLLLSPEIWTSARRFEIEGLKERQTLNALIMNFADIGWTKFFSEAKSVYRAQSSTDKLDMTKFFALIDRLNREAGFAELIKRWYHTGVYVRPNAWQLAFLKDIKINFRNNIPVDEAQLSNLALHDRWFDRLTDNFFGRVIAMVGTWVWYRLTVRQYKRSNLL